MVSLRCRRRADEEVRFRGRGLSGGEGLPVDVPEFPVYLCGPAANPN